MKSLRERLRDAANDKALDIGSAWNLIDEAEAALGAMAESGRSAWRLVAQAETLLANPDMGGLHYLQARDAIDAAKTLLFPFIGAAEETS